MRRKDDILAEINAELPPIDWRAGARRYLDLYFAEFGIDQVEGFALSKPLSPLTVEDPAGGLAETVGYLNNFANAVQLLRLPRGSRVLDVACGGGWVSHWLSKLGYQTLGIDISDDFVGLARRRLVQDPGLGLSQDEAAQRFVTHDIERAPLAAARGRFDAAILESCLHHFFDPIAALTHITGALADDGVVLIIEGENRRGAIKPEYMQVMTDTQTLERPYPRELLLEVLDHAGLAHREFLGSLAGYIAMSDPAFAGAAERLRLTAEQSNVCVCAKSETALRRVVPTYRAASAAGPERSGFLARLFGGAAGTAADTPSVEAPEDTEPAAERLEFNLCAGGNGVASLASGWWEPDVHGVWSDGPSATLRLATPAPAGRAVVVEVEAMGYAPPGTTEQRVRVVAAGREVEQWQVRPNGWRRYRVELQPAEVDLIELAFNFLDAACPAEVDPGSTDPRLLGMAIRRATVSSLP